MGTDKKIAVKSQDGTFTGIYCPKYLKRLLRFLFVLLDYPDLYGSSEGSFWIQYVLKFKAQRSFCENLRYYCLMHTGFKSRSEMSRKDEKILRAVFPSIDPSKVVAYRINPLGSREEDGVWKRCRGPYAHSVIAFPATSVPKTRFAPPITTKTRNKHTKTPVPNQRGRHFLSA